MTQRGMQTPQMRQMMADQAPGMQRMMNAPGMQKAPQGMEQMMRMQRMMNGGGSSH